MPLRDLNTDRCVMGVMAVCYTRHHGPEFGWPSSARSPEWYRVRRPSDASDARSSRTWKCNGTGCSEASTCSVNTLARALDAGGLTGGLEGMNAGGLAGTQAGGPRLQAVGYPHRLAVTYWRRVTPQVAPSKGV